LSRDLSTLPVQYLVPFHFLKELFNELEEKNVQDKLESAANLASTKILYEEKMAACEGELERVLFECNQSIVSLNV